MAEAFVGRTEKDKLYHFNRRQKLGASLKSGFKREIFPSLCKKQSQRYRVTAVIAVLYTLLTLLLNWFHSQHHGWSSVQSKLIWFIFTALCFPCQSVTGTQISWYEANQAFTDVLKNLVQGPQNTSRSIWASTCHGYNTNYQNKSHNEIL